MGNVPVFLGRPVSEAEAAYAAGFFDGEGSIILSCCFDRLKGGQRNRYHLHSSLAQKDRRPLAWLRERFGGSFTAYRSKYNHREGHCEMWGWRLGSTQTLAFLRATRPFLIVKADQADLAFTFAATMSRAYRFDSVPDEVVAERRRIFEAMKAAKRDYGILEEAA